MPKVVGKSLATARAQIVRAHCKVGKLAYVTSTRKLKGIVLAQAPKPRTKLPNGSKVRMTIGKGPKVGKR